MTTVQVRPPVTVAPVRTASPVAVTTVHIGKPITLTAQVRTPVTVTAVRTAAPVAVATVRVGKPITLNATLGQAGLWTGEGPPTTIVGAVVGDTYLNTLNGDLFRLDPGA